MATLKLQQIPQLSALLPYIDLVPNQEYLVCRIRGSHALMPSSLGGKFDSIRFDLHSRALIFRLILIHCRVPCVKWTADNTQQLSCGKYLTVDHIQTDDDHFSCTATVALSH